MKKDTRVGNGFLKAVCSYLFLEQPNLEGEISLRGEGLSQPDFWHFIFSFVSLRFLLEFIFPWLCGLETEEDDLFFLSRVACHPQTLPKTLSFPSLT